MKNSFLSKVFDLYSSISFPRIFIISADLQIIPPGKIANAAEMINILGKEIEEYRSKTFNENELFFDYGKKEIKDKRKMGHLTILKK